MPMRIRTVLMGSIVSAMAVTVAVGAMAVVLLIENRDLRSELRITRVNLEQALLERDASVEVNRVARDDLAAQSKRMDELATELEQVKARSEESRLETAETPGPLRAQRVRAYLGNQQVGMGWLLPAQIRTNAVDGPVMYEPAILLDEAVRSRVGVTRTNVVERDVSRTTTVNYNYPQAYSAAWPIYWVRPGRPSRPGHDPSTPAPAEPERPPTVQSPFLSTRTWHPDSGWTQGARGRPGGEWISSGTRGGATLPNTVTPVRTSPFPERY
jgi:hypothetical protein